MALKSTVLVKRQAALGTAPVFFTAISTILGAIMFLRFGYAVGSVGFLGAVAIILVGHLVTIPTALALAEIATNQKVEGGGEYFIISRSFGLVVGAAIGIGLFLSQAISVAFYVIAFAEAFDPVFDLVNDRFGWSLSDKRLISMPALAALAALILYKGANVGLKALYAVAGVLFLSLVMFFLGSTEHASTFSPQSLVATVENADPFFLVFAICFPAFTGMTAGVGLSGDLKSPSRSIPIGTLAATILGMIIYVAIAFKLAVSASPMNLVSDQLAMSRIALWGPIIPIGLACATISSAMGSALVAPRTLQALGADGILPRLSLNRWLAAGKGPTQEPVNASLAVFAIAFVVVGIGDVNFVAQIISMFFMVTYGAICLISFLEHFAADPSYRPVFRSRWYISLLGALMCLWLMFKMSTPYAILSVSMMVLIYLGISHYKPERRGLAAIFQGAFFQLSRQLQVFLQKTRKVDTDRWRPSVVCISKASFQRLAGFDLLRWISHRYGFGTYIHFLKGYLSKTTSEQARDALQRLVKMAGVSSSNVFVDTLISPSYTTAICQAAQLPGISGKENNMILFEFSKKDPDELDDIISNYQLLVASGFDVAILGSSDREFGYKKEIHVWITPADYDNASLMILLAYIILGHPEWNNGVIKLFAAFPEGELDEQRDELLNLVQSGRLPLSAQNVHLIGQQDGTSHRATIRERSRDADLTIVGFVGKMLKQKKAEMFTGYDGIGNVLFINTTKEIELIDERDDEIEIEPAPPEDEPSITEPEETLSEEP
jgi:solute carrier family 12 sodium/potassium/chloride transporter 2